MSGLISVLGSFYPVLGRERSNRVSAQEADEGIPRPFQSRPIHHATAAVCLGSRGYRSLDDEARQSPKPVGLKDAIDVLVTDPAIPSGQAIQLCQQVVPR